jgi:sugar/nucleoside kinase (ribokinase family)
MRYLIGSRSDFSDIPKDTTAVMTEGAHGVTVHSADGIERFPAVPTEVVDATGAGDAFAGGLLWGLGMEKPLFEGVRLGLAWAAATVQVKSSMPVKGPGDPTADQ